MPFNHFFIYSSVECGRGVNFVTICIHEVRKKGKEQELIQSSTTPDPGLESSKIK